jgi:hypothetical protein
VCRVDDIANKTQFKEKCESAMTVKRMNMNLKLNSLTVDDSIFGVIIYNRNQIKTNFCLLMSICFVSFDNTVTFYLLRHFQSQNPYQQVSSKFEVHRT